MTNEPQIQEHQLLTPSDETSLQISANPEIEKIKNEFNEFLNKTAGECRTFLEEYKKKNLEILTIIFIYKVYDAAQIQESKPNLDRDRKLYSMFSLAAFILNKFFRKLEFAFQYIIAVREGHRKSEDTVSAVFNIEELMQFRNTDPNLESLILFKNLAIETIIEYTNNLLIESLTGHPNMISYSNEGTIRDLLGSFPVQDGYGFGFTSRLIKDGELTKAFLLARLTYSLETSRIITAKLQKHLPEAINLIHSFLGFFEHLQLRTTCKHQQSSSLSRDNYKTMSQWRQDRIDSYERELQCQREDSQRNIKEQFTAAQKSLFKAQTELRSQHSVYVEEHSLSNREPKQLQLLSDSEKSNLMKYHDDFDNSPKDTHSLQIWDIPEASYYYQAAIKGSYLSLRMLISYTQESKHIALWKFRLCFTSNNAEHLLEIINSSTEKTTTGDNYIALVNAFLLTQAFLIPRSIAKEIILAGSKQSTERVENLFCEFLDLLECLKLRATCKPKQTPPSSASPQSKFTREKHEGRGQVELFLSKEVFKKKQQLEKHRSDLANNNIGHH